MPPSLRKVVAAAIGGGAMILPSNSGHAAK